MILWWRSEVASAISRRSRLTVPKASVHPGRVDTGREDGPQPRERRSQAIKNAERASYLLIFRMIPGFGRTPHALVPCRVTLNSQRGFQIYFEAHRLTVADQNLRLAQRSYPLCLNLV